MKVFKEEQKFTQPLVYIGLSVATIVTSIPIIKEWSTISQLSLSKLLGAFSGHLILGLVILLFLFLKLKTRIDQNGISFQFTPFHFEKKHFSWNEINKVYVRNYDAISEFGGWGIKGGVFWRKSKGKAYNVKGDIGLQLELKNGKRVLIGTQKKLEIERVLKTYEEKIKSS